MTARVPRDPYAAVIRQFERYGVRYVVVGMTGINYYAATPAQSFGTMDFDVLLNPTIKNIEQALSCLKRLEFTMGTAEGPLTADSVRDVVRQRRTVIATTSEGLMVELWLQVSGFTFADLARDVATFMTHGVPIKVGRLQKLLASKKLANRPKDRQFLKRYGTLEA